MKLTKNILGGAIIIGGSLLSSASFAADGEALYKAKGCAACHGPSAMGAVGPRLAGIQPAYLHEQFILIRDGKRTTGKAAIMAGPVKSVTDDEAKAITTYLGNLK